MNSDEEKALFEEWGWEYNFIKREWSSPDGNVVIPLDDLVEGTTNHMGESQLRAVVQAYGRRS